jgi:hypothetical protein
VAASSFRLSCLPIYPYLRALPVPSHSSISCLFILFRFIFCILTTTSSSSLNDQCSRRSKPSSIPQKIVLCGPSFSQADPYRSSEFSPVERSHPTAETKNFTADGTVNTEQAKKQESYRHRRPAPRRTHPLTFLRPLYLRHPSSAPWGM